MPELPEVETTARGIAPHLTGARITGVSVREPRLRRPVPADLASRLHDRTLLAVSRRAKYLQFDFGTGQLLIHLGMSGSLRIISPETPVTAHDHVDLCFGDRVLRYRDPRRFGLMLWLTPGEEATHPLLAPLGIEPLCATFDGHWLYRATREARRPIKSFIMDSHRIVGVGNIYASESLFRAGIHPLAIAGRLGPARCERLAGAIRDTLRDAIAAGGSSLRDFVRTDGQPGYFQQQYFVYGRDGEPCRHCGRPVERMVIGQRASFLCTQCQRR
ncbi:bifunctional DNA-formamidopyrimidine glycosylase/DNA-(apurinic or apyrimidinic site) lyase [Nitrogeniibacter mangrovi]|uniref:Formamidopyrimidine-DNA glycosylase n=1 Tax=Nitrogeniibacter mangrovi TaxID=2016596 RepID=A0A6C1B601_9RHOO|nr:bifunctional DNA-formamidopyrimidine glycosylase/DNA-(apurinic or apyrimidinic site) lyase [Nitrogeniibacter mangrovi]QID18887.1 bifunctional DNA-formamidopyrimidine glycosylase/DNA-(apurinic or apyrimidinic site) lyase [Nitrogeniibacter mangrovi]